MMNVKVNKNTIGLSPFNTFLIGILVEMVNIIINTNIDVIVRIGTKFAETGTIKVATSKIIKLNNLILGSNLCNQESPDIY
jgi:hypothetical protein